MALETVLVYRITSGDNTYPHFNNFTVAEAGKIVIDDSDGAGDAQFGDYTHTGGYDTSDQDVVSSTVSGISNGDLVDLRYKYTFTGSDGSSGTVYFLATNGQSNYGPLLASDTQLDPNVTYSFQQFNTDGAVDYEDLFICFASGTRIVTPDGATRVEELQAGDIVRTVDDGPQPLRWIGHRQLDCSALSSAPNLIPIRIRAGALGPGIPSHDLIVSPQHRVLVRSAIAHRMCGTSEVLLPAKKLLALPGVSRADELDEITYVHFLFDRHQLVISEGAVTESLFTGPEALRAVSPAARKEILTLFPELSDVNFSARLARPEPIRRKQMDRLIARHVQNRKWVQPALH